VKSTGKSVDRKQGVTVTSSVDLEDYDKAYFMLARQMGKKQVIVGQLPAKADEKGNLKEEWDGRGCRRAPAWQGSGLTASRGNRPGTA